MANQFPNLTVKLPPKNDIPHGYRLMVHKWSYPEERIGETVTIDGEAIKKMLTLDMNIPSVGFARIVNASPPGLPEAKHAFARNYPCPHTCPGCFNNAELTNPIMTLAEVFDVIEEAKRLGLESIKFLGPGELLANPQLFTILDELLKRDITVLIFTKAAILGNDSLSRHYHGIRSEELTRRLAAYPHTIFLIGARSFDPDLENQFIPQNLREFPERFDYHTARNTAMERLANLGMNNDLSHQRMAIACAPVTSENISGAFEMYIWATERNIPIYIPPTMVSGKGHRIVEKSAMDHQFDNDYIDLAVDVYTWAIERGVMTLDQLYHEGAASYIGIAPCNQLTHGLYVHYDGTVWRCPGNDTPDFIVHSNVRNAPLKEIWKNSRNYDIQLYNNGCVKDGISLPMRFYDEVPKRVAERVALCV